MVTVERVRRGDVFLVRLDPTRGGEMRKTRPCVVISPDDLNAHLRTVMVAPLTKGSYPYPYRVPYRLAGREGFVVLDQIRTVDTERFTRRLGRLTPVPLRRLLEVLRAMFLP